MARGKRKKQSRASQAAAKSLQGRLTTPEAEVHAPPPGGATRKGRRGSRITMKAVGFFLLACILLDLILYLVFRFGFDSCYGVLCLIE